MTSETSNVPVPSLTLNDEREIPQIGLGTYKLRDEECISVVREAIELGYRHFDTATLYKNEEALGKALNDAIAAGDVTRDELLVTSKVWHDHHGADKVREAFQTSLDQLGLDYLDLYMVHWPWPQGGKYIETFEEMARLQGMGQIASIGVANFYEEVLEELMKETGIVPVVNQIELNPTFRQPELLDFHKKHGIITQAWSPLARGKILNNPDIKAIAAQLERSAGQVALRYLMQKDIVIIPKSSRRERLIENLGAKDFELSRSQMEIMDSLNNPEGRSGNDPRVWPGDDA